MLGFIENFQLSEGILIAIVAVLIFGKRLPQVAGQAAGHVGRARRALNELWRESGLEEEMRKVQRDVDLGRAPYTPVRRAAGAEPQRRLPPAPAPGSTSEPERPAPPPAPRAPTGDAPDDPADRA